MDSRDAKRIGILCGRRQNVEKWRMLEGRAQGYEEAVCLVILVVAAKVLVTKNKKSLYRIKFIAIYSVSAFITLFWLPIFLLRPRDVRNGKLARHMTNSLSEALGVRFQVRGAKNIRKDKGGIVVCNHQCTLDALGLMSLTGIMDSFTVIVKKSLLYLFPFGPCAWLAGTIFIDRRSPQTAYQALGQAQKVLDVNPGTKFWFFPEGTRNQSANETRNFLPFKKGAFRMAIQCQIPIIPIVNSPYLFLNKAERHFGEGTIITEILPPISTLGMTEADVEPLLEKTRTIMLDKYQQLFRETSRPLAIIQQQTTAIS